jgi:hypothetical protein
LNHDSKHRSVNRLSSTVKFTQQLISMMCSNQTTGHVEMDPSEANLITEIEFWREMIELRQDSASTESVERMQQALALAELRLRNTDSNTDWRHDA